eukprot:4103764-Lingulodinium_polyedra.AAC.1
MDVRRESVARSAREGPRLHTNIKQQNCTRPRKDRTNVHIPSSCLRWRTLSGMTRGNGTHNAAN